MISDFRIFFVTLHPNNGIFMERISFVNKSVFTHGIVCALCLSLLFACSSSNDEPTPKDAVSVVATVVERNTYGNLLFGLTADSLKNKGF